MKIESIFTDLGDYRESYEILVDGKEVFSVIDGEPEDNNLNRNFADCKDVVELMEMAYEAGKSGKGLEIIHRCEEENG